MAASGRVPRARLPPDGDLRDLRRHGRRRPPRRRRRGRRRRARSGSRARSPAASSPTSTTRRATKPIHPAWAAHGGVLAARLAALGARGPARRARGPLRRSTTRSSERRGRDRPRRAARRPRRALGDAADRVSSRTRRATSSTARSARRRSAARRRLDPDEIEDDPRRVPAAGVSLVLEPAAPKLAPRSDYEAQVQPAVLDRRDARPRPRRACRPTRTRRSPTRACSALAREGALRDEGVRHRTRPRSRAACGSRLRDGRVARGRPARPARRRPRTRCRPTRSATKFRENAALALAPPRSRRSRTRCSSLEEQDDLRGGLLARARCGASRVAA